MCITSWDGRRIECYLGIEMIVAMRQLRVSLLSILIVLGMGLQALPVPCQSSQCGTTCAISCTHCPPSCTCHLAPRDDGAATLHCGGGIATADVPDLALPKAPMPAALSAAPALMLTLASDRPQPRLATYRPIDRDPPLRPPAT